MKLRLVLLASIMLSYGSAGAVDIREVIIEEKILNEKNKFDLKAVLSNIQKNEMSGRTWRYLARFLIKHALVCLEDKAGRLYFVRNDHSQALGLDASCLMVNRKGIKFYQNNTPGKYYDGLRPSINYNFNEHNKFLSRGQFTDISGKRNGHLDIRERKLIQLSQDEILTILANAGIERLGFAFSEDLDITINYVCNNNNNVIVDNEDDSNFSLVCRSDLSSDLSNEYEEEETEENTSIFNISHMIDRSEDSLNITDTIKEYLQGNNNNNNNYSVDYSYYSDEEDDINESGYWSDSGSWRASDNCHHYFYDENGQFRYNGGYESE